MNAHLHPGPMKTSEFKPDSASGFHSLAKHSLATPMSRGIGKGIFGKGMGKVNPVSSACFHSSDPHSPDLFRAPGFQPAGGQVRGMKVRGMGNCGATKRGRTTNTK